MPIPNDENWYRDQVDDDPEYPIFDLLFDQHDRGDHRKYSQCSIQHRKSGLGRLHKLPQGDGKDGSHK